MDLIMKLSLSKLFNYLYGAVLLLTPLVMYPRTSELFEFNKMLVIYLITGLIVSLWVARMLLQRRFILRMTVFSWALVAFLASQVLSTIYSIDPHTSIFGYYGRFNGGLLSILAYVALFSAYVSNILKGSRHEVLRHIELLLKVSVGSSVIVMLWGLPSHFGYDLSCFIFSGSLDVACWTDQFKPTVRVFSTLGQPNWLAAYLVIHAFIGIYFYLKEAAVQSKAFYALYIAGVMLMLLYTRSRSGLLALAVGGVLLAAYLIHQRRAYFKATMKKSWVVLCVALILPIFIAGTGISRIDGLFQREATNVARHEAVKAPKGAPIKITDSSVIRKIVWQGAFSLGLEYPWFGSGVETFAYAYNFLRPFQHNDTSEWDFVYNKAHNELFNYFATTGFVGLITYLLFFVMVALHIRKLFQDELNREEKLLLATLLAAFLSIFVTNFFGFSTSTINLFYYLIPAWIVLLCYRSDLTVYPDEIEITENDAMKLVIPACLAFFCIWYVAQYFRADTAYAYGDGLYSAQEYQQALPYLYEAYDIRQEHVYADKISQIHAQQAFVGSLSGEPASCLDSENTEHSCIALSNAYVTQAIKGSPQNPLYRRTQARNNFLFFQATQDKKYYDKAIKSVDNARELAPTDPRLPYLRALFALGLYETQARPSDKDRDMLRLSGLSSAQFAIELKGDYTSAYYLKGLIQKALKDTDGARKTFQYILDTLEPENEQAQQELETL
jgi:putative inorganic carbon (hco3(-)) transporter